MALCGMFAKMVLDSRCFDVKHPSQVDFEVLVELSSGSHASQVLDVHINRDLCLNCLASTVSRILLPSNGATSS